MIVSVENWFCRLLLSSSVIVVNCGRRLVRLSRWVIGGMLFDVGGFCIG